jgi:VWFA-related protein
VGRSFRIGAGLLLCAPALGLAQQTPPSAERAPLPASVSLPATVTGDGLVRLDVVVTDKSGKPIAGLEPRDFTLLDDGLPERILSFQAYDGITTRPDPPVEVILVIDTLNLTPDKSSLAKSEVERFLRRNNGHLAQPVSIYLLSNTGLSSMPQPVADSNVLAEAIALGRDLPVVRQSSAFRVRQTYAENGQIVRLTAGGIANRSSVKSLASIAIEERRKPGKKLLFWLGPGWPVEVLGGDIAFDSITELSTRLREARISLWSATEWPYPDTHFAYQDFLAPLKSGERVQSGNLALAVLAIQSGGGLLETSSDLEGAIRKCIEKESTFYTLTFDPPFANEEDDYHDLKLVLDKPDLTALTNTGYYNQPVYHDHPSEAKRISVEQLEQMLGAAHGGGDKEVAQELFGVELTERMSSTKLSSWKTRLPGERSRAALVGVADRSAFLALPATDVPATAPPDFATRRQMLSRTIDYLSKTIVKLPDFFATRTTVQYAQPPKKYGETWKSATSEQWLHVTETSNTTVSFRDGKEVVDAKALEKNRNTRELDTKGTFGPILSMVFAGASAARSQFTWLHWEQGADGPQAVFRYAIPQDVSDFEVGFCCLADPDGTIFFRKRVAYHGEVTIDPETGAILRLTVVANLEPRLPMLSSAIMVEYGPVVIGEKTYICPTRSVSFSRQRTVDLVREWGESFGVYGRFETILNDVTFGKYHLFRAESRILPGSPDPPNER